MNSLLSVVALICFIQLATSQGVVNPGFAGTLYQARPCYFVAQQTRIFGHASFVHKTDNADQCIDACEAKREICKSVMFFPVGSCIFNCVLIPVNSLDVPAAVQADTVNNAELYNRVSTCTLPGVATSAVGAAGGLVPVATGAVGQVGGAANGAVGQVGGAANGAVGQVGAAAAPVVGGATNLVWETVPERLCFKRTANVVLSQVPREVQTAADATACLDLCSAAPATCNSVEFLPATRECVTHKDSVSLNQGLVQPGQGGVQSTLFDKIPGCVPTGVPPVSVPAGISPVGILPVGIPPVQVPQLPGK